ncbi:FAD-dependent oxidoreductase [Streptomyces sp. ML-6]|uniref:FAD-dependent oxidoreductase n=1 Tax=Streptomyces sp. ML-6 TaxID=2982693 RepID=UPI0024C0E093|nr:FAD-dependent oxidoreductase [Streptomyces sp. ML-6]MDK0520922.1 FAD-dependent oxidoreductase [Streptomyces sp. ML-6]
MSTPSHPTGRTDPSHTDLLVVGGGPAGCAAARTAASVGMSSILIEPDVLCRNLYRIPALNNVLGGHTDGTALATAITAELHGTELCRIELGRHVTELRAHDDHVTATLDTGRHLSAPYAVVATGVGPRQPHDTPWITAPPELTLPPLWRAGAEDAEGRTLLVLGGDRPIGTFLRAHPRVRTRLLVAYPAADDYKTEEIRDDPRVTLLPAEHLTLHPSDAPSATAELLDRTGTGHPLSADAAYLALGSAPTSPPGDLIRDPGGYCPPTAQHPRLIVAGDLRSPRYQRIQTALGSGSESALRAYYTTRDLPTGGTG